MLLSHRFRPCLFRRRTVLRRLRRTVHGLLSALIILSLLIGATPPAQAAAPAARPTPCTGSEVFLPVIAAGLRTVASTWQEITTPAAAPPRTLSYQPGKTYIYDWRVEIDTRSGQIDKEGMRQEDHSRTYVTGRVLVRITGQEAPDRFVGNVVIEDYATCVSERGVSEAFDDPDMAAALRIPLVFKQRADGVIVEVQSAANGVISAINLQKGILNALQAKIDPVQNAYVATETGTQGTYDAQYTLANDAGSLHIARQYTRENFDDFIFQGTDNASAEMTTRIDQRLDPALGVIRETVISEQMRSADEGQDNPQQVAIEGEAAWSELTSVGSLRHVETIDTPAQAAALAAVYRADSIGGVFDPAIDYSGRAIDLETIDLAAEMNALDADPTNPLRLNRLWAIVDAGRAGDRVDDFAARIVAAGDNLARIDAYLALLATDGSQAAQEFLVELVEGQTPRAAGIVAAAGEVVRSDALMRLSLVEAPVESSFTAVATLARGGTAPLNKMAVKVLGAMAGNVARTQPQTFDMVTGALLQGLQAAGDEQTKVLYINALGNSGHPNMLALLDSYFTDASTPVKNAAYFALRKVPGQEVETKLAIDLGKEELPPPTKQVIFGVLDQKKPLGQDAAAAVDLYKTPMPAPHGGTFKKNWDYKLGGENAHVTLPGEAIVATPPYSDRFDGHAMQRAVGKVWQFQKELLMMKLSTTPLVDKQRFDWDLTIAGNVIYDESFEIQCQFTDTVSVFDKAMTLFEYSFDYPITWVIIVSVTIRVSAHLGLSYGYDFKLCNPLNMSGDLYLTPTASTGASLSVGLWVALFKAGGELDARLLDTTVPAKAGAVLNLDGMQACAQISYDTKPLTTKLVVFVDYYRIFKKKWERWKTKQLWSYETKAFKGDILPLTCYK